MENYSPMFEKIDRSIEKKVELIDNYFMRYAVRAMLACLFLTLGTAIAFAVAMQGDKMVEGLGRFLFAFMFSWSLIMILYMNAELGTSNMLYMTVGVYRNKVNVSKALKILFTCILFNMISGIVVAYFISLTGPYQGLEAGNYLFEGIARKLDKSTIQIIVEGAFANIVVNTAVLITLRMKDDGGRVPTVIFVIFIFAFLGFEHVIANFPAFSLAYFASGGTIVGMTTGSVLHNIFFAFIGNYIGGGLIIGLTYAWLNKVNVKYLD